MKATELMIGDWVMQTDPIHNGEPMKITEIRSIHTFNNSDIYFICSEDADVYDKYIEPIPLTAEIMEKNLSTTSQIQYCWDDFLSKSFGEDFFEIRYHGDVTELVISIRYVHELQHVLKLCGIEKEIEIEL